MIVVVIILGVLNVGLLLFLIAKKSNASESGSAQMLKADLTELNKGVLELKDSLNDKISDKLDKSQKHISDSIQRQFEQSAKIITDISGRLTKLDETNKRVVDVADELKSLQNVLQNPKQRGVLGEFYLKQILENMLPPGTFELQYRLAEGLVVDAVIKLDDKFLPIDSKFSLENYNRLVEAKPAERPALEKLFKEDLKKRIDETAKYILPKKGTLEQALMFIPSEAIYYDLLANKVGVGGVNGRDLMHYAAVDKRVTVVGPSTLSAMLQIVSQGLNSLEIQKDTELIRNNVEQLGKHLKNVDGYFIRLGNSLGATVGHFNSAHKELGKVDKDVIKISGGTTQVEPILLDRPTVGEDID
ncbi:DNA recombination protein RmuC [Candidatus Saccharibacteria bacterium]|nr:DNA recombination protein RmuC [Candidatus Saccharibacteria bacterium]MBI3338057.1 DNA recombination protein RmuC [Candidatus Saccharibacteria bacterium]